MGYWDTVSVARRNANITAARLQDDDLVLLYAPLQRVLCDPCAIDLGAVSSTGC